MKRRKPNSLIMSIFCLIAILTISACARKKGPERIVAIVNDYKMTVEDFNYESKEILRMGKLLGDIPVTKEDILDALITKEILLQEAQEENLDKDKDFMKTIELYWEQTLLKNLLTKKSRGIERDITVYENEIIDYYNKMKNKIKAKVLVFADKKLAHRLLDHPGDVAEYVKTKPDRFSLLYIVPSKWYILGENNTPLETSIVNVDSDRELVKIDGKWALIIIEERAPNELEPLSAVRDEMAKRIKIKKERALMNEWIDGLRSKARIKINKKLLGELH